MSIFKYLTISHLQKVLAALDVKFLGINNDIDEIKEDVKRVETDINNIDVPNPDWNLGTNDSSAYILNKPAIRAGNGSDSIEEGATTTASGNYSHAEGSNTIASEENSHAEGRNTTASGYDSHAEGSHTTASGTCSHAEGFNATASGEGSHAEGYYTTASGLYSHAEGSLSKASGIESHAEGRYTIANGHAQHVQGKYNIEDAGGNEGVYAHIVGNGTAENARSNAHTLDWSGNGWYAGKLTVGTGPVNNMDVATKLYVDTLANNKQPKRLVVTVTSTYDETTGENIYSADKTFTEVQTAMNEGREVYFDYGGLSNQAYYDGPDSTYIYADIPGNAHSQLIYSSNGIEIGYDYSYYRKADKGTIGGDLREVDEGTKIYQTAQYAHSKDDILWVMSDVGFNWDMYVAKNDIAVGDELSPGNTGNLQAITVEDMIDMKVAAASSSISCATMAEIEEMCSFLGFRSVTIDTSDYESTNV